LILKHNSSCQTPQVSWLQSTQKKTWCYIARKSLGAVFYSTIFMGIKMDQSTTVDVLDLNEIINKTVIDPHNR
jgi:hypothetical protein